MYVYIAANLHLPPESNYIETSISLNFVTLDLGRLGRFTAGRRRHGGVENQLQPEDLLVLKSVQKPITKPNGVEEKTKP